MEECLRGNELAWAAVIDKYKNLVYSAPMKYRMSAEDAADIFQEVWIDLYSELKNLRRPGALEAAGSSLSRRTSAISGNAAARGPSNTA